MACTEYYECFVLGPFGKTDVDIDMPNELHRVYLPITERLHIGLATAKNCTGLKQELQKSTQN